VRFVGAWLLAGATLIALLFRPWSTLRQTASRGPWIGAPVALACLLVLMFSWLLAVLTLLPLAIAGAWAGGD
jgi:hypothetical protein